MEHKLNARQEFLMQVAQKLAQLDNFVDSGLQAIGEHNGYEVSVKFFDNPILSAEIDNGANCVESHAVDTLSWKDVHIGKKAEVTIFVGHSQPH